MITVTENAVKHLRELLQDRAATPDAGLRLMVEKGGCAGWQYTMKLDSPAAGDQIFEEGGVKVMVDGASFPMLDESQIDYEESLSDAGFKVNNPNATRSCGCGSSFEPKAHD